MPHIATGLIEILAGSLIKLKKFPLWNSFLQLPDEILDSRRSILSVLDDKKVAVPPNTLENEELLLQLRQELAFSRGT